MPQGIVSQRNSGILIFTSEEWEMSNVTNILKAWNLASEAHGTQEYGNLPYLYHLVKVVERVRYSTDDEDIIIAAILHDVVEDTEVTNQDILLQFNLRVAQIVDLLTHRKFITYTEYLQRLSLDEDATLIKVCDLEENLSNNPNSPRTKKYLDALENLTQ
jgi:(p)ppGpp synthase/HD superfamily hydrolase